MNIHGKGGVIMLNQLKDTCREVEFSGGILIKKEKETFIELSEGYANRSERIENSSATRYGIASGCKLFTSIAICQLVQEGILAFETRLEDCLDVDFPSFDQGITIHHLLTHTAGIPDYFDEEVMDDFEELWIENPMYLLRSLKDFLPLFQHQQMKSKVGERFHYNNAGYIILGLIVEQASGMSFSDYVEERIFRIANMTSSGYFEFDALPQNTALGYIELPNGQWKTNIYSLPVKGGSDGGAFVTIDDLGKIWDALIDNRFLQEKYTNILLKPHVPTGNEDSYYGYGVWIKKKDEEIFKYHIMGYDPGVSFHSAFYPNASTQVVICSNKSEGAYEVMQEIERQIEQCK